MGALNNIPKSNPFKVPEGYFEEFDANLSERIYQECNEKKRKWKISGLKPYIAIAASFLLIFSVWALVLNRFEKTEKQENPVSVDNPEFSYFENLNTNAVIDLVTTEELFFEASGTDWELVPELTDQIDLSIIMEAI
jgi:hypothetical protein